MPKKSRLSIAADLHINYESVPAYEGVKVTGANSGLFEVEKMRFLKKDRKDTIIYNSKITIEHIPLKASDLTKNWICIDKVKKLIL